MKTPTTSYIFVFVPLPQPAPPPAGERARRDWPDWTMFIANPRPRVAPSIRK